MGMSIKCAAHKCETMPSHVDVNEYTGATSSQGDLKICFLSERVTEFARFSIDINYCPFCGKHLGGGDE